MDKMSFNKGGASPELSGNSVRYSPARSGQNGQTARVQRSSAHSSARPRTGSGTRTSASSSANPTKRRNARTRLSHLLKAVRFGFIALLILLVGVTAAYILLDTPSNDEIQTFIDDGTFFNGITINGKDVGGLTYSAARDMLIGDINDTLRSVNITVKHGTSLFVLNAADLGVSSTLDEVLRDAISLGRDGSVIANAEAKSALEADGKSYMLEYTIDEATALQSLAGIGALIDTVPVEPSFEPDKWATEPSFSLVDGADGYMMNETAVVEQIKQSVENGIMNTVLSPELELVHPTLTSDALLANAKLRSTFQTSFGGSRAARNEKRVGNIQKATTLLNGAKVEPGEEFNFNAFIGPRTEAGGWPLAPGIVSGERYEDQAGGGICQVSTTLYNALLCGGSEIQITERYHHSWPSSYADKGLDSTVTGTVDSGKSLNFINNTGATLYIFAYCDTENYTMTIFIYGAPLPEGVTYQVRGVVDEVLEPPETVTVENPAWPSGYKETTITSREGYKVTAYRDKLVNGEVVETETLYSETYRTVTGEVTIGTGDASLPKPTSGS